jgi:hypothetical protein
MDIHGGQHQVRNGEENPPKVLFCISMWVVYT